MKALYSSWKFVSFSLIFTEGKNRFSIVVVALWETDNGGKAFNSLLFFVIRFRNSQLVKTFNIASKLSSLLDSLTLSWVNIRPNLPSIVCTKFEHLRPNSSAIRPTQVNCYFNSFCDYSSQVRATVCLSIKIPVLFNFCQCLNAFPMNPLMGSSLDSWNSNSPNSVRQIFNSANAFVTGNEFSCSASWMVSGGSLKI